MMATSSIAKNPAINAKIASKAVRMKCSNPIRIRPTRPAKVAPRKLTDWKVNPATDKARTTLSKHTPRSF